VDQREGSGTCLEGRYSSRRAIQLAAAHPFIRYHAIEVRPFYRE
jgi:hypothetical protein